MWIGSRDSTLENLCVYCFLLCVFVAPELCHAEKLALLRSLVTSPTRIVLTSPLSTTSRSAPVSVNPSVTPTSFSPSMATTTSWPFAYDESRSQRLTIDADSFPRQSSYHCSIFASR